MILLIAILILSILFNIFLFCQCAKYYFLDNESDSLVSYKKYRTEVRESAHRCKKELDIVISNMNNSQ